MLRSTRLLLVCSFLTLCTLSLALGQGVRKEPPDKTQIITASVAPDGVRIAAPSAVVQLRLELYDDAGQKLLDTEQRGGNVLDWHLQGGAGERVADGTYLCVVTIKNPSGRLSQKLGLVTVSAQSTTLRSAGVAELSPRQAQVVGPIEGEDEGLAVMPAEDAQPVTVLTHTGDEAQITRTRGALSFRVGDFFSAKDKEQMRLTEEGNFGIGTAKPKVKLDVAGMIRAREGFLFSNGSALNVNDKGALTLTSADGSVTPNVAGTGAQNRIAKWTDNLGTLGDAGLYENGGLVVIGQNSSGQLAPLAPTSGQFHTVEVGVPPGGKSPLTLAGGSGVMEFWKDLGGGVGSPAAAVSFGMAVPGTPATNDMLFSSYTQTAGSWNERMRLTNSGNLGIGTNNPAAKLDVAGNIKLSGANSSLIFPDGSSMTTAAAGSTPSGTSIVSAVNDAATTGTINDNRLSPNVARLSSANTFSGDQTVNGLGRINGSLVVGNVILVDGGTLFVDSIRHRVEARELLVNGGVTAGGVSAGGVSTGIITFSDGSVQTTSASKIYTTFLPSADIEISPRGTNAVPILQLALPPVTFSVTYMVTATVQFENTANLFAQNNSRLVSCKIGNQAVGSFRLGGAGSAMDQLPITLQALITQSFGVNSVTLSCGATDGGTDRSYVFARMRRFSATKMESLVTQP